VAPPGVRDARDEMADLRRLLDHAHLDPPTCSWATPTAACWRACSRSGIEARRRGSCCMDTTGRDGRRRQLAIWPRSQAPEIRKGLAMSEINGNRSRRRRGDREPDRDARRHAAGRRQRRTGGQLPTRAAEAGPGTQTPLDVDAGRARDALVRQPARSGAAKQP
jgi:hypothetical protein